MELAGQGDHSRWLGVSSQRGYAMAVLLVGMSIMAILMSAALPVWSHMARREREEELIWRGQQYARAVGLFQRKYANTYPPTLEILIEQKFLRKKYKDPITQGDFMLIPASQASQQRPGGTGPQGQPGQQGRPGQMTPTGMSPTQTLGQTGQPGQSGFAQVGAPNIGIAGVVSKSKDTSIKIYNGRQKYNEWAFVYIQTAQRVGPTGPGAQQPGRGVPPGRGGFDGFPGRGGFDGFPGGRGGRPPIPGSFGQPPFGQPGQQPFGQPGQTPFGQPGQPPFRAPGQLGPPGPFVPQPSRPPARPPGF